MKFIPKTRRLACLLLVSLLLPVTASAGIDAETCQPFYASLEPVPHETLYQRVGPYTSKWFQATAIGCQIVFVTSTERLSGQVPPDLSAAQGTRLYEAGWRQNPAFAADEAGTTVVGIERDDALCLIYKEQPTYGDDDGQTVQADYLNIRVECMEGENGAGPWHTLRKSE